MTTTDTPIAVEAAESERHIWFDSLTDFERQLMVGYFIGSTDVFDQARAWVEKVRVGTQVSP